MPAPICPCGCNDTRLLVVFDWHSVAGFVRKNPDMLLKDLYRPVAAGKPYCVNDLLPDPACCLFRCPECGRLLHVEGTAELRYHVMGSTTVPSLPDGESGWQRVVIFDLLKAREAISQENGLSLKRFLQRHTYPIYQLSPQRTVLAAHRNGTNDSFEVYVRSTTLPEDSTADAYADFSAFHYAAACYLSGTWSENGSKQLLTALKENSHLIPAFFRTQCTDDELPCFCDVAEDYMQETASTVFFDALFQRVLCLENRQQREGLLGDLRFAAEYVQDDARREGYLQRIGGV